MSAFLVCNAYNYVRSPLCEKICKHIFNALNPNLQKVIRQIHYTTDNTF